MLGSVFTIGRPGLRHKQRQPAYREYQARDSWACAQNIRVFPTKRGCCPGQRKECSVRHMCDENLSRGEIGQARAKKAESNKDQVRSSRGNIPSLVVRILGRRILIAVAVDGCVHSLLLWVQTYTMSNRMIPKSSALCITLSMAGNHLGLPVAGRQHLLADRSPCQRESQ